MGCLEKLYIVKRSRVRFPLSNTKNEMELDTYKNLNDDKFSDSPQGIHHKHSKFYLEEVWLFKITQTGAWAGHVEATLSVPRIYKQFFGVVAR